MPLAIGIRPEQGSLPRQSPRAASARNKLCLFPCLLADEVQQSRARKDPLRLPAVFKNPTGLRVEGPRGQEAAVRLPADPTLPGLGKNLHSFAAARARRDREVYCRRCPHDADPPGAFIFGHTYAAGPWGLSEGGRLSDADRPPGLLGGLPSEAIRRLPCDYSRQQWRVPPHL